VSAGIRYQRDRQERRGTLTANSFVVPVDFVGAFDAWLPKFTFAYDVTPKLRVGAMAEKAYNPGGTTIRVDTSSADNFKAESLWDYELFARAEFGNGRGSIESNLFYYDMRNPQRSQTIIVFTPSGLPVGFANLFNIPKARTYGAEGKLDLPLTRTVSARVAMGLLATKVVRTDAESADLEGKEFDRSPHFTGSAAFDWRPTDRAIVSLQARHHGSYFTDPENDPDLRVGSATIIDGRAEYRFKRLSVFAQVHNILDTFAMRDFFSVIAGEAEDPRTFSIGAEARF
jgi:outer membrane receptor protein involved in Fe transport